MGLLKYIIAGIVLTATYFVVQYIRSNGVLDIFTILFFLLVFALVVKLIYDVQGSEFNA